MILPKLIQIILFERIKQGIWKVPEKDINEKSSNSHFFKTKINTNIKQTNQSPVVINLKKLYTRCKCKESITVNNGPKWKHQINWVSPQDWFFADPTCDVSIKEFDQS